jgi:hypothetical protein
LRSPRGLVFSGKKSAVYYNAGAGSPPFIPVQGAFLENGAGATWATVQLDGSIFWLDQDERGYMVARRASGYGNGDRVSTHATELAWQQYGKDGGASPADAIGWTYQENGHPFWVLYFPAASATWVYDVSTSLWHERGYWIPATGSYIADRAMCHTFNFGKHLVGDWASGNIYDLSSNYYDDFGNSIRGNRRTPTTSKENEYIYFASIEFIMETGLSPVPAAGPGVAPFVDGNGNPRPAQLMLRWSNNVGKNWSNWFYLSAGFQGQYDLRVIRSMLGRARKRLWDVAWTDPIPWRFPPAGLNSTTGQSNQNQEIVLKKISADANVYTFTAGPGAIFPEGPRTLVFQYDSFRVKSDGTNWWLLP